MNTQTKTQFTPGPELTAHIDRNFSWITAPSDGADLLPPVVARDLSPEYAVLFAAAPEMFAALEALLNLTNERAVALTPEWEAVLDARLVFAKEAARAVISKVKGEA